MRRFGLSFAPKPEHNERFALQYRYSTRVSPDVALLKLSSQSVGSRQDDTTQHITHIHTTHMHTHIHTYTCTDTNVYTHVLS